MRASKQEVSRKNLKERCERPAQQALQIIAENG